MIFQQKTVDFQDYDTLEYRLIEPFAFVYKFLYETEEYIDSPDENYWKIGSK